jgi:streptogramin lyase
VKGRVDRAVVNPTAWLLSPLAFVAALAPAATVVEYPIPLHKPVPHYITTGPDRAFWFTVNDDIGRIDPAGTFTDLPAAVTRRRS